MEKSMNTQQQDSPLVELAPEEAVIPALVQSAHPVEFIEANPAAEDSTQPAHS